MWEGKIHSNNELLTLSITKYPWPRPNTINDEHLKWRTYRSSTWNNSHTWSTLKEAAYNYWKLTHWEEQLSTFKAGGVGFVYSHYIYFVWSKKYMKIIKEKSTWRTLTTANFPNDLRIKQYKKHQNSERVGTLGIIW